MVCNIATASAREAQHLMRALVIGPQEEPEWAEDLPRRVFKIRAADSDGHRSSANILVDRMYAWRGYKRVTGPATTVPAKEDRANRMTLVAIDQDETVGTMSIGFDCQSKLLVDELFPAEVGALRNAGRTVCEFTKLAMDSLVRSKHVLASLFHVAYIYAHRLNNFDCLLIEVNPRHVRFYERMLGFKVIGPERLNRRVNAPAVLMCLELSHARRQIAEHGGTGDSPGAERSLYPYFFSPHEEAGIIGRLSRSATQSALQLS